MLTWLLDLLRLYAVMNHFPSVRHYDLALMGQIHIAYTIPVLWAGDRDPVSRFESVLGPTIGPVNRACGRQLGLPTHSITFGVLYLENNRRVRIHELQLDYGTRHRNRMLLIIATGKSVMSECWLRN